MNTDRLAVRLRATLAAELEEQVRAMNTELLALETDPGAAEHIRVLFRIAHTLKGAARAAGVPEIERTCHALESLLAEARDGARVLGHKDFTTLFAAADELAAAGAALHPVDQGTPSYPAAAPAAEAGAAGQAGPRRSDAPVRVDVARLDHLSSVAGLLLVAAGRLAERPRQLELLHHAAERATSRWRPASRRLRLALERLGAPASLTAAVSLMEESLRELTDLARAVAADTTADARTLRVAADDVADEARRLRMRPFAEACEALPRAIRDLAALSGKEVDFEVGGGDVEFDRAVLDALREALLHLVRNAVDHGIESPADRVRSGKPPRGRVKVVAVPQGSRVVVTVTDDGAGIDPSAVRGQLERRGLPAPATDRDLVRALFDAGLSTRAEVSVISGRGVGLDSVRAAAHRVRASVDVTWTRGNGTRFTLECPTSVATVRVVLVRVAQQVLALPTHSVERLVRVRSEEIRYAEGRAMLMTGGSPVPLVALARLLPPLVERPASSVVPAVLLRAGDRRVALAADELLSEDEVVVRPLGRGGDDLPAVNGAALLATGRVALILNEAALIEAVLGSEGPGISIAEGRPAGPSRTRILIVDDSITTRTLEQGILEAAGYDVATAVDGADGWRVLQEHGADLVVADVEMPRLDGFGLCEAIRASRRFRTLPVVLVTALESSEHRARGLEVGADAYIGKSGFDQRNLLETLQQLVGRSGT